jgi:hypothetical protein
MLAKVEKNKGAMSEHRALVMTKRPSVHNA